LNLLIYVATKLYAIISQYIHRQEKESAKTKESNKKESRTESLARLRGGG